MLFLLVSKGPVSLSMKSVAFCILVGFDKHHKAKRYINEFVCGRYQIQEDREFLGIGETLHAETKQSTQRTLSGPSQRNENGDKTHETKVPKALF